MALTEQEAYDAMFLFLREYWERGDRASAELGGLLGSLDRTTWVDGGSADLAMDEDWRHCVQRVQDGLDPYK
jgi:hypothetical protein